MAEPIRVLYPHPCARDKMRRSPAAWTVEVVIVEPEPEAHRAVSVDGYSPRRASVK